jgi:hypothetical protein
MWTRPLCFALLMASAALACGSDANIVGSVELPSDASATPDVSATLEAGADADATATLDAAAIGRYGAAVRGGAEGPACKIPPAVSSVAAGSSCHAVSPWHGLPLVAPCGSYFYEMSCSPGEAAPALSMGCFGIGGDLAGDTSYCCPCEGVSACVSVDLSTYDRSCVSDSDCIAVIGGTLCAGTCACAANAAINIDGQSRYLQTVAAQLSPISLECNGCPPDARVLCIQGLCGYCLGDGLGDFGGCSP